MGESRYFLMTLMSGLNAVVSIACSIGLLVVIGGAVRRHRPDAYQGLLGWAIASMAITILTPIAWTVVSGVVAVRYGIDGTVVAQAINTGFSAIVHVVLVVVLAKSLVKLAQPPKPIDIPSAGAYR